MEGRSSTKVGIIGCGTISRAYLDNLTRQPWGVEIACLSDLEPKRAEALAAEYGIRRTLGPEKLVNDPEIEAVLCLTTPASHASIGRAAIAAGKHFFTEKPLALTYSEAAELVQQAQLAGRQVGCAPDTVLGAGIQRTLRAVEEGKIGQIVGASATMLCPGHEGWHPNPDFYYEVGGGPVFDMGPYYLTALVYLLGPVDSVVAFHTAHQSHRTIGSGPRAGETIPVRVPTHYAGLLSFRTGVTVTVGFSFDVAATSLPPMEVYGSTSTLLVPDPNTFDGPVELLNRSERHPLELDLPFRTNCRGLGLAEFCAANRAGRLPRISGEIGAHVVEIMEALNRSGHGTSGERDTEQVGTGNGGVRIKLESTCRPSPPVKNGSDLFV